VLHLIVELGINISCENKKIKLLAKVAEPSNTARYLFLHFELSSFHRGTVLTATSFLLVIRLAFHVHVLREPTESKAYYVFTIC
jgi:hypothetical protein